jgi:hypothetical protein
MMNMIELFILFVDPCDDGEQRGIDGSCEKCPRGTYRVKTDAHTCVQCADGKTTENTGSTADTACIRKSTYFCCLKICER